MRKSLFLLLTQVSSSEYEMRLLLLVGSVNFYPKLSLVYVNTLILFKMTVSKMCMHSYINLSLTRIIMRIIIPQTNKPLSAFSDSQTTFKTL